MNFFEQFAEWFNECYDKFKTLVLTFVAGMCSVLSPIKGTIYVLSLAFVLNFFLGLRESIKVDKNQFSLKKAFESIIQLTVYLALIFLINKTFSQFGDLVAAETGTKWATYIVVYFYTTNITRNAALLWPKLEVFSFMYDLLTTKIFDRLKDFLGLNKNKDGLK